jgi:hypothetical protein
MAQRFRFSTLAVGMALVLSACVSSPQKSGERVPPGATTSMPDPYETVAREEPIDAPIASSPPVPASRVVDAPAPAARSEPVPPVATPVPPPKPLVTRAASKLQTVKPERVKPALPNTPQAPRAQSAPQPPAATPEPTIVEAEQAADTAKAPAVSSPEFAAPVVEIEAEQTPPAAAAPQTDVIEAEASEVADPVEQTQVALLSKVPEPVRDEPDLSKLKFDIEHLPMTLAGGWRLDRRRDRVDGKERCLLYSPKQPLFDGYDLSAVQLEISSQYVTVRADSNIDTSYPNTGLQVDARGRVPFESTLVNERTVYTSKPVQLAMAQGSTLKVGLGFWPTWPVTRTQYATFDLDGFGSAYRALQACTQQQTSE